MITTHLWISGKARLMPRGAISCSATSSVVRTHRLLRDYAPEIPDDGSQAARPFKLVTDNSGRH